MGNRRKEDTKMEYSKIEFKKKNFLNKKRQKKQATARRNTLELDSQNSIMKWRNLLKLISSPLIEE